MPLTMSSAQVLPDEFTLTIGEIADIDFFRCVYPIQSISQLNIQKHPEGLTVQLMAIQVLRSGVAFATALMWAWKVLLQTLSTSLPFPWLPTSIIPPICFLIAAIALSLCSSAPISVLPTTSRVFVIRLRCSVRKRRRGAVVGSLAFYCRIPGSQRRTHVCLPSNLGRGVLFLSSRYSKLCENACDDRIL